METSMFLLLLFPCFLHQLSAQNPSLDSTSGQKEPPEHLGSGVHGQWQLGARLGLPADEAASFPGDGAGTQKKTLKRSGRVAQNLETSQAFRPAGSFGK